MALLAKTITEIVSKIDIFNNISKYIILSNQVKVAKILKMICSSFFKR